MESKTVELIVKVRLDPIPGAFHTEESARRIVYQILHSQIGHYEPAVTIK